MTTESKENVSGGDAGTEQLYRLIRIDYPKRKNRNQNKKQGGPGQKGLDATKSTAPETMAPLSAEPGKTGVPQKPPVIPESPPPESEMMSSERDTPGSPVTTVKNPLPMFPETRSGDPA